MTTRVFLAALLGGVAMFVWSSIAHTVLPLGEAGIKEIPNEGPVVSAMHSTMGETPGLYLYPGMTAGTDSNGKPKMMSMDDYGKKLAGSPSGLLIYHPPGAKALTPGQLITEFLTELVEAFLAVMLLVQTRLTSFGSRVGFITAVGVLAAVTTNIPYWNWYGFPVTYTAGYMATEIIAFLFLGLVAAAMLRKHIAPAEVARVSRTAA